jgi:hypothetical protein
MQYLCHKISSAMVHPSVASAVIVPAWLRAAGSQFFPLVHRFRLCCLVLCLMVSPSALLWGKSKGHAALSLPSACVADADVSAQPGLRVMFWNVENLFDTNNNPLTADDDFLPEAGRHWTKRRYLRKLRNLAQGVTECGAWRGSEWHAADIVALAEVEGEVVLADWLRLTPLGEAGYVPIVTHSSDVRGIQVALLYRPEQFELMGWEEWEVPLPPKYRPTRHLLHVWGVKRGVSLRDEVCAGSDTLDLVVCHLPSRYGGAAASVPSRSAAHRCLDAHLDSLEQVRAALRLLVMGDMNDYPRTTLLRRELHLETPPLQRVPPSEQHQQAVASAFYRLRQVEPAVRYNLMLTLQKTKKPVVVTGSHKYQGVWGYLDQFFVTGRMLHEVQAWGVFAVPDMLADDASHSGLRPKRSYYGYNYEGGYSDHLPIVIDLR